MVVLYRRRYGMCFVVAAGVSVVVVVVVDLTGFRRGASSILYSGLGCTIVCCGRAYVVCCGVSIVYCVLTWGGWATVGRNVCCVNGTVGLNLSGIGFCAIWVG